MTYRSPLAPHANRGLSALVTGGGTGIGAAVARELAHTGAKVAICGRRPEPIERVRSELEASGAEVLAVAGLDVREPEMVASLIDDVLDRFGRIDVLVNNAGGQFVAPAEQISLKGWRAVHRLNVDAVWDLTRSVAERSMIPNRGGLVVFLGFSPRRGVQLMVHSAAARAALENLAGGLAIEWSRYGIRAVCVACGAIDTEGFRAYGDAVRGEALKAVPLGRLGRPEEVACLIAFLASPGGRYITGTTIVVDGGSDAWGFGTPPPAPSV
ncbi:MAG TPA: SDR family oxidoreductase [Actinomycetota bacterium]|nr:SDR family oxidoreductase [Actinomycetota bacterium]